MLPGVGEFGDELFDVVDFMDGQAEEGDAGGGEEVLDEAIALAAVGCVVAGVVDFDAEHGHPVVGAADEEVDVLLADFLESALAGDGLEDVGESGFDLDEAAILGDLEEAGVESGFSGGEQGLGLIGPG